MNTAKFLKIFVLTFLLLVSTTQIKAQDVDIIATVSPCILNLTVYPEKRIPTTLNWGTNINLLIKDPFNTPIANVSFFTNNSGQGTVDLCAQNIFLSPGSYNLGVKGFSHLNKNFNNIVGFNTFTTNVIKIDLADKLLAGEVSVIVDNYINSLDLSYLVNKLYTFDLKADLNRDDIVNSLDLSNQVYNLYTFGDS